MHAEFAGAAIDDRHVLRDLPDDVAGVAEAMETARASGALEHQAG